MTPTNLSSDAPSTQPGSQSFSQRQYIFDSFRRWGYLKAQLDPLGQYLAPETVAELDFTGPDAEEAAGYYCSTVGAECMHIPSAERRQWLAERLETNPLAVDEAAQQRILELLTRADIFEQTIQSRYLGTKRFSLEGVTALIPFLDELFNRAAEFGAQKSVMGMSHRGRLSVMVNTFGKSAADIFSKFEDVDPRSILGGGDVKYHVGATGTFLARNGETVSLHLVSNPSHLEAVDPVAMGRAKAKQARYGADGVSRVLPVIIHGDAAFAGQGIWAETMNLASIEGYSVGGSIQIVVNNLIGFTAEPEESNSTRFATDLAKRLDVPIFHVNAEDAEAVVRIAALAAEYRHTFHSDVVVDLIGYRRHGHSEVDDPTITQPLRYARIKNHPPLYEIYAKKIGVDIAARVKELQAEFGDAQKQAQTMQKMPTLAKMPEYWSAYKGGPFKAEYEAETGISREEIGALTAGLTKYPSDFHIHPKIAKLLEQRAEMGQGKRPFDYGMAEALAFGSLVKGGTPVRLSGQDSQRGTFNQRHSVLIDIENEQGFVPLNHLAEDQAPYEAYNSMLSEAGVMGFEYGYSRDYPETLVLWEAQFGDFANGAQIVIDQFLSAAEDKWGLLSGLTLLLPHGYEGQGPEHSSARIERYLQLTAHDNIQVCQPSTAAQYFHLLRRQALRKWRKPLVVFTPKSMLRHPDAISPIEAFSVQYFQNVLPETEIKDAKRLLVCTGKIGHELRVERAKRKDGTTGIVFLEQLYPFPEAELIAAIEAHPNAHEIVWVQEEPQNMGAHSYVMPRLRRLARNRQVLSVKRSEAASPATGSGKAHEMEQKTLIELALSSGLQDKVAK
ncbi:2-oxoglutarate dehydrogenase E1 component [Silvibacterium dinghuense]|uniref:oxoglutarate dehydrogenase (succinyl-transferring) n=1 Tax=Silvibacterium dinghuense TaxID=1560006 RepID=A0A4Q1SFV2_9BACT|nr:2-oxoglutarate dehydrogenase E1 component [Silvibacterium dinghuense]RXS96426.1 2-oxoglutarate dehydrogenase E1 component [Silvibacterium dinghuense]GGG90672.1 2-oxoglutarate dehydrogenase E1 component [Silvibacterium dinghuense]